MSLGDVFWSDVFGFGLSGVPTFPPLPPPVPSPTVELTAAEERLYMEFIGRRRTTVELKPQPPKSLMAGPILAWRVWRVSENGRLISLHYETVWPFGYPLVASSVPERGPQGIYAMKSRDDLATQEVSADQVIGQVALWGRVIEHVKGYRAQYAYPYKILLTGGRLPMPGFPQPARDGKLAALIRERYGCLVIE